MPFRFVLPDENFSETKERLQKRMITLDGGMAKYRFALVPIESKQLRYISDGPSISCRHILRTSNFPAAPKEDILYTIMVLNCWTWPGPY